MSLPPQSSRLGFDDERRPETILGGKYQVQRVIGEGAFGRVYLAYDPLLRRNAAVKELLASRTLTDYATYEKYLERFHREARAAGRLDHPNIVGVYELAADRDDNYYLVMQYIEGTDLRALLDRVQSLPVARAIAIALDIAHGLEMIHENDIVHRDLKPANIMITVRGVARITDFGIAQMGHESQRTQMATGHPGTPLYMSPEQASGVAYVDGRSDLYALGLVLYEMLIGEPFARRRQPLSQIRPDLPVPLLSTVHRLLEPNAAARYQSASDVVADLRQSAAASTIPIHPPDHYQIPGINQPGPSVPSWSGVQSPLPPTTGHKGVSQIDSNETRFAPPPIQPSYNQPSGPSSGYRIPSPQTQPDQAQFLSKNNVRLQSDRDGLPRVVVDYGPIMGKIILYGAIGLFAWFFNVILIGILPNHTFIQSTFVAIWLTFTLVGPILLIRLFVVLRKKARAVVADLQQYYEQDITGP